LRFGRQPPKPNSSPPPARLSIEEKNQLTRSKNPTKNTHTGLVAQQQCVGPLQLPLADVAVVAQSHQDLSGAATSIGEQPIKGLLCAEAMARLALGEALTNLCFARATSLEDVKASVNWMYAAKMGDEGAAMYRAACALR